MRRLVVAAAALALAGCGTTTGASGPSATPPTGSAHAGPSSSTPTTAARLRVTPLRHRLPGPLAREAVVPTAGGIVVAGGLLAGDVSSATTYLLRPDGSTRPMPPLPVPVHDTAGALLHGHPLVIGGGNAAEQDVVQEWQGGRWSVVGHLPQARSDLVTATVGDRVLVLGGYDGTRPAEPTILASTDARTWHVIGRLPVPVRYAASTVADGAVWLFGGERSGVERREIQRVDPATGNAHVVGELPVGLGHAVVLPLGRRLLVLGGRTGPDTVSRSMWWFDPHTARLTPAGRLHRPLADAAVALSGGRQLVIGGESPQDTDQVLQVALH